MPASPPSKMQVRIKNHIHGTITVQPTNTVHDVGIEASAKMGLNPEHEGDLLVFNNEMKLLVPGHTLAQAGITHGSAILVAEPIHCKGIANNVSVGIDVPVKTDALVRDLKNGIAKALTVPASRVRVGRTHSSWFGRDGNKLDHYGIVPGNTVVFELEVARGG